LEELGKTVVSTVKTLLSNLKELKKKHNTLMKNSKVKRKKKKSNTKNWYYASN